jgi:hypothetical protein
MLGLELHTRCIGDTTMKLRCSYAIPSSLKSTAAIDFNTQVWRISSHIT